MFTHRVLIIRGDTDIPFFYNVDTVLQDPTYLQMTETAKSNGSLISENMNISEDNLTLERVVVWDSVESFEAFKTAWYSYRPDYYDTMLNYSNINGHMCMVIKE